MRVLVQCVYLSVAVILISCNDEASPIGSDFFDGSSLDMITIDTLTIQTSTVTFDSLVTSDATRLLVGRHKDDDLGEISSSAYFQLGPLTSFSIDKQFTSFTRAELKLVHEGYSYYDTTAVMSFEVHKVTQDIEIKSDDPYLYNTRSFKYDLAPMGTISYKAKPNTLDTVSVPLSEAFGRDIITLAQRSAVEVSSTVEFLSYFRGLVIVPTSSNGPLVGFSTAAEVRIYYIDRSQTPSVERYLSLQTSDNLRYNKITCDRVATALNGLDSHQDHYSTRQTNNKGYIQSGVGLGLRVELPYLRNILIQNQGITIVSATLEISPARDNGDDNVALPGTLVMTGVNYKNEVQNSYTQKALLVEDFYLERDTHYEVDVTTFINLQLAIEEYNQNALVFTTDDATFRSSVSRLYAGDQLNDREMKLRVSCLVYSK